MRNDPLIALLTKLSLRSSRLCHYVSVDATTVSVPTLSLRLFVNPPIISSRHISTYLPTLPLYLYRHCSYLSADTAITSLPTLPPRICRLRLYIRTDTATTHPSTFPLYLYRHYANVNTAIISVPTPTLQYKKKHAHVDTRPAVPRHQPGLHRRGLSPGMHNNTTDGLLALLAF